MARLGGVARNANGVVIPTPAVTVYLAGTLTLASVYTDVAMAVLASPAGVVTGDDSGNWTAYVHSGAYKVVITSLAPYYPAVTYDDVGVFDPDDALLAGRVSGTGTTLTLRGHGTTAGTVSVDASSLTVNGRVVVDGTADQVQLTAQAHSTQTAAVLTAEKSDGSDILAVYNSGVIECPLLHNAGGTGATQAIASGTYTPTVTNVTNVAASTPRLTQWIRVGSVVMVSGVMDIDPTATAITTWGVSLPIASNFANSWECGGAGAQVYGGIETKCVSIQGDATNNRAQFDCLPQDAANRPITFSFMYLII
jgi:hypothetical protein